MGPYGDVNVEKLLGVRDQILRQPERFNMSWWIDEGSSCGTVCCIAGWTVTLEAIRRHKRQPHMSDSVDTDACRILGLTPNPKLGQCTGWHTLFGVDEWPAYFRDKYDATRSRKEQARTAADMIEYVCGYRDEQGRVLQPIPVSVAEYREMVQTPTAPTSEVMEAVSVPVEVEA